MVEQAKSGAWIVGGGLFLALVLATLVSCRGSRSCANAPCSCRKSGSGESELGWCSLSPSQLRHRRAAIKRDLVPLIETTEETPSGFAFRFPADRATIVRILDFVQFESACCSQFGYEFI